MPAEFRCNKWSVEATRIATPVFAIKFADTVKW